MRRVISTILILAVLLTPCAGFAVESEQEQELKQIIQAYYEARYKMLSTLTYDSSIKDFLDPDILKAKQAINEADVLDTIIKYRKLQVNDLRFERFKFELRFDKIKIAGVKAWVSFLEDYELYFNCAPTVKNQSSIEHLMLLKKTKGKWVIVKDDYSDPEGIKKTLSQYFLQSNSTIDEVKNKVIAESGIQLAGRFNRLEKLMEGVKDAQFTVLNIDKPIAYANGTAGWIDSDIGVTPIRLEGKVLLPVKFIVEKMGAKTNWEGNSSVFKAVYNGISYELQVKSRILLADGKKIAQEIPVSLIQGQVLLPAEIVKIIVNKNLYISDKGLIVLSNEEFDPVKNNGLVSGLTEFYDVLYTKTSFPRIDGSTATYPLSIEIGKELLGLDETGAKGFITHKTTHNAYVNLIEGNADIIFVTQPSPEETKLAKEKGIELEVIPICKEGFVFLVNKNNPVDGLTVKQIQDIYQGKIKSWKEVGGENSEMIAYQREANSGSQTLMENTVMKGLKMAQPPKETLIYGMGELIDRVADYSNAKNALGYSVYYYATTMYSSRNVKLLAIDGVEPNKQTIKDGSYPFTVGYYAVLRKDEPQESNARKLLNWLLGEEGQMIVDKSGFVPLR